MSGGSGAAPWLTDAQFMSGLDMLPSARTDPSTLIGGGIAMPVPAVPVRPPSARPVPPEPPPPAAAAPTSQAWDAFRDAFIDGYFELNPTFAVTQGRHEFDGQIGDWSAAGFARRVEFLRQAVADAGAFDAASLSDAPGQQTDTCQVCWWLTTTPPHATG